VARFCWIRRAPWRVVVAEFPENSINAMTPDTHALKAINIGESTIAGLLDKQASRQYCVRYASATLAAHATAIPPYFNTFIASCFLGENQSVNAIPPHGMSVFCGLSKTRERRHVSDWSPTGSNSSLRSV
jgi:hypothetical protein